MGRNRDELERTLGLASGSAQILELDLLDGGAVVPRIRDLAREEGRLYGLCHCAGVVETRPLASFEAKSFRAMMEVNMVAGLRLAQAVARRDVMTERGGPSSS